MTFDENIPITHPAKPTLINTTRMAIPFNDVGRLPFPGDNVAIATRDLDPGTRIDHGGHVFSLSHGVLEGHRFALRPILPGEDLLSWDMPFGRATKKIEPGDYVCNGGVLEALRGRAKSFPLPEEANFSDEIPPFSFEPSEFVPAGPTVSKPVEHHFLGFDRGGRRGVGTRNYIVILGISSRVAGFVRHLEKDCKDVGASCSNVDGVVSVAHTEGDDAGINNRKLVLRTLAGFSVHPNAGAVLFVDQGDEAITFEDIQAYMTEEGYPIDEVPHAHVRIGHSFQFKLAEGRSRIESWIPEIDRLSRSRQPISTLNISLQCGGSDAFSGISGNPLAAWVAHEVVAQGGKANLAETDELLGAEAYILQKVKSRDVAERFLAFIRRFVERAERHGSSAAGNPSGGNKYRGLYNIYLKSLGAAMKKHPAVRLDDVIDYGQPMEAPGYYFMDSPGNDLESVAGQVASGGNVIFFVTGNGSITNFPFVPTIKIVTTTRRYELLPNEMDVNAGAYLDGESMDRLGEEMLRQTLDIASGQRSAGEKAGHAQVQLWRNWRQPPAPAGPKLRVEASLRPGVPLHVEQVVPSDEAPSWEAYQTPNGVSTERLGLIVPTSLCAGQVARMATEALNKPDVRELYPVDRFVTLVHTEGCGVSSGTSEEVFLRTMLGHVAHPNIQAALFLEHGCEKTHNDYFRAQLEGYDLDPENYGWASIQLDGGIQRVIEKMRGWFDDALGELAPPTRSTTRFGSIKLGLLADEGLPERALAAMADLVRKTIASGGTVVVPRHESADLSIDPLLEALVVPDRTFTLSYGQRIEQAGFHLMESPSMNWQETVTGLGATSTHILVYVGDDTSRPGHPFIPLIQVALDESVLPADIDVQWTPGKPEEADRLLRRLALTGSGRYDPVRFRLRNLDFQVTRGLFGISL